MARKKQAVMDSSEAQPLLMGATDINIIRQSHLDFIDKHFGPCPTGLTTSDGESQMYVARAEHVIARLREAIDGIRRCNEAFSCLRSISERLEGGR